MTDSTEAAGLRRLANFRPADEDDIQRGIRATMSDVVRHDARHNPNAFRHPGEGSAIPASAAKVVTGPVGPGVGADGRPNSYGWQPEAPYSAPGGATAQLAIEKMTATFDTPEATISRLTLTQLNELLVALKKREATPAAIKLMAMIEAAQLRLGAA
jgi:hypothetical protein